MNVDSSNRPLILIFDLDETLFFVQEKQNPQGRSPLSKSTENILSKSDEGIKTKFTLQGQLPNVAKADKITAIAREKMKAIFQKIHSINMAALSKELSCPIFVKIMTTASYDEKHIKRLLDEFYFEKDNPIRTGAFRIEYFNKHHLATKAETEAPVDRPTKKGTMDSRKATLIEKKFEEWGSYIPNLRREDVILIDNADVNIVAVEALGFKAIHYPTTTEERLDTVSYTENGPKAFDELWQRITQVAEAFSEQKLG